MEGDGGALAEDGRRGGGTGGGGGGGGPGAAKHVDYCRDEATKVQAEMDRVKQLPPSSTYANHRLKVLQKVLGILHIPKKDRTSCEVDELERLFTELAF